VFLAGCTPHPTAAWVTQQARGLAWQRQEGTLPVRILLHDRDRKFPRAFDAVFRSEGLEVLHAPLRCPQANCYAERWIGSARRECLDHLLFLGERHLLRARTAFTTFYNQRRPHQGLDQQYPIPLARRPGQGPITGRDVLGGIIHDYERREVA
jgi:transposase InsO family protein